MKPLDCLEGIIWTLCLISSLSLALSGILLFHFCRPYYDIGALGTSSLYRVGGSIFAFTPQVNIALVAFGECTKIFVYVEQRN